LPPPGLNLPKVFAHIFRALATESGDLVWRYETDGRIEGGASLAGDLAFVGSSDNYLYALDVTNGDLELAVLAHNGDAGSVSSSPHQELEGVRVVPVGPLFQAS